MIHKKIKTIFSQLPEPFCSDLRATIHLWQSVFTEVDVERALRHVETVAFNQLIV